MRIKKIYSKHAILCVWLALGKGDDTAHSEKNRHSSSKLSPVRDSEN